MGIHRIDMGRGQFQILPLQIIDSGEEGLRMVLYGLWLLFVCSISRTGLPATPRLTSQTKLNPNMQDPYALTPESQDYRTLTSHGACHLKFTFSLSYGAVLLGFHTTQWSPLLHKSKARPNQSTGNSQNFFQLDFHFIYSWHVTPGL